MRLPWSNFSKMAHYSQVSHYSGWCSVATVIPGSPWPPFFIDWFPNHLYFTRGENHHPNSRGESLETSIRCRKGFVGTQSQKKTLDRNQANSPKSSTRPTLNIQLRIDDRCFSTAKGIFWESFCVQTPILTYYLEDFGCLGLSQVGEFLLPTFR